MAASTWALQIWPSWLNVISSGTGSASYCSCSSHYFYLEGRLELAISNWVHELPVVDASWKLAFLHMGLWAAKLHTTMWCCLSLLWFCLSWVATGTECDYRFEFLMVLPMRRSLAMANSRTFSPSTLWVLKTCPPWASLNTLIAALKWLFQSQTRMWILVVRTLATAYCSWS